MALLKRSVQQSGKPKRQPPKSDATVQSQNGLNHPMKPLPPSHEQGQFRIDPSRIPSVRPRPQDCVMCWTSCRASLARDKARRASYIRPDGTVIREPGCLKRIRSLVIPPAWTDVWICTDPQGHLQATGRDARGRKQYRYHPRWNHIRNETKYDRMVTFGRLLPRIRRRVAADLSRPGLPRDKILRRSCDCLKPH